MDPFDDVLRGVRADGAGVYRKELSAPWTLQVTDALTLLAPLHGDASISGAEKLRVGDTAVVRGPVELSGESHTVLLVGAYHVRGKVSQRLLNVLPPTLVLPESDGCSSIRDFLDACGPGQQVVQDRLLDWLLVCTLRDWFDLQETPPSGWYQALSDDVIGPVLRAMHAAPAKPWTLAALAGEAGVSRTTLANRFAKLVGEPPLAYLTDWRMTLAADLLTDSTATVGAIAHQVGYADAFGFSTAFKRFHGTSPSEYRQKTCSSI